MMSTENALTGRSKKRFRILRSVVGEGLIKFMSVVFQFYIESRRDFSKQYFSTVLLLWPFCWKHCSVLNFAIRKKMRVFTFAILVKIRKSLTETLISLLFIEICDIRVSLSYFDQILGKRESQTRQIFNFAVLWNWNISQVKNRFKVSDFSLNWQL